MWGLGSLTQSRGGVFDVVFCSSKLNSGISEQAQPARLKMNSKCRWRLSLHACGQMGPQAATGLTVQPAPTLRDFRAAPFSTTVPSRHFSSFTFSIKKARKVRKKRKQSRSMFLLCTTEASLGGAMSLSAAGEFAGSWYLFSLLISHGWNTRTGIVVGVTTPGSPLFGQKEEPLI